MAGDKTPPSSLTVQSRFLGTNRPNVQACSNVVSCLLLFCEHGLLCAAAYGTQGYISITLIHLQINVVTFENRKILIIFVFGFLWPEDV